MKKKKNKIPKFKNEAEEAEFWSTHDTTEFLDEMQEVTGGFELDPALIKKIKIRAQKKHLMAIRLDEEQYQAIKLLALQKSIGLSSLIRIWISEALFREKRKTKS